MDIQSLTREAFIKAVGHAYDNGAEVAEAAWSHGLDASANEASGLVAALSKAVRGLPHDAQLALIKAQSGLADSPLFNADERAEYSKARAEYQARYEMPFILATKGKTGAQILAALNARLMHGPFEERAATLGEMDRVALERLGGLVGNKAKTDEDEDE